MKAAGSADPGPASDTRCRLLWFAGAAALLLSIVAFVLWGSNGPGILLDVMLPFCT